MTRTPVDGLPYDVQRALARGLAVQARAALDAAAQVGTQRTLADWAAEFLLAAGPNDGPQLGLKEAPCAPHS